jgi:hypothetical protein
MPTGSPEDHIAERLALHQIWPTLTPGQQAALNALAIHGSALRAAEELGVPPGQLHALISRGRRQFKERWHEGENPPPLRWRDCRREDGGDEDPQVAYRKARRAMRRRAAGGVATPDEAREAHKSRPGDTRDAPGPEPLTDLLWYAGSRGTGRTCHRLGPADTAGGRRSLCGKNPPKRAAWVPVDDIPDVEFAPCLTCTRGHGVREQR